MLEHFATPLAPSYRPNERGIFRSGIIAGNYLDNFSSQVGIIGDFGPLEIGASFSRRFYGRWTDAGKEFERESKKTTDAFSAELARTYASSDGHVGRLGIQYIRFPASQTGYVRLGVNMGVYERKDSPWILRLNTHVFFRAKKSENNVFSTSVEIGQRFKELPTSYFRFGGFFGWTYRTREEADPQNYLPEFVPVRYEHMLFSVGPWAEYASERFSLKLSIPWRIWMDKEEYRKDKLNDKGGMDASKVVHYPTDTNLPEVTLQLSVFL